MKAQKQIFKIGDLIILNDEYIQEIEKNIREKYTYAKEVAIVENILTKDKNKYDLIIDFDGKKGLGRSENYRLATENEYKLHKLKKIFLKKE